MRFDPVGTLRPHFRKATEYFVKEQLAALLPPEHAVIKEFVHFGLTSQDINNVAIPLALKNAYEQEYLSDSG